jgi:predicted GNAT superfamily acetyltransferase
MSALDIRLANSVPDMEQIEELQRVTWGMPEVEVLPARFLHAMRYNGCPVLGAYDGQRIVGFVFGVLGTVEGLDERIDQVAAARLQMYSVIMGVLPEYQGMGIGHRLKLAQREFALRIGVRLITWTFDPLESRNAYLNITKLGVISRRYERDFHGRMGGINEGLPTDRFFAEWWVTSNRVQKRVSETRSPLNLHAFVGGGARLVNEATVNDEGLPVPAEKFERSEATIILVEVPADFQVIKHRDMELALAWRSQTREVMEHYVAANYLVTDFVRHREDDGRRRNFYVMTHGDS